MIFLILFFWFVLFLCIYYIVVVIRAYVRASCFLEEKKDLHEVFCHKHVQG